MSKHIILMLAAICGCIPLRAAALPPEKLLPNDTVLVVTAPDWAKARMFLTNLPYARLWQDPAIKPFKDKFMDKFTAEVVAPAERNFKIKFPDYQTLAQGQVTFALIPAGAPDNAGIHFAHILIVDTKDRSAQLKSNLADIQKKWADAGRPMKSQKLRDLPFTTLIVSPDDLSWDKIFQKAKPAEADDAAGKPPPKNVELTIGQSDSLLIVGDSTEAIEKVLSRQAGGLAAPLDEQADFQADFAARLRNSPAYAWANTRALLDSLARPPAGASEDSAAEAAVRAATVNTMLRILGLGDVTSASFSYQSSPGGVTAQFFMRIPEGKRQGLLKAFAPEPKDANPPSFVPADAVKFWRWRVDIPHGWTQLESTLNEQNPMLMAAANSYLNTAGKDKDKNYDLKAELLANMGDDIIGYDKLPNGSTLAELKSAPSIFLIGSPNPEKLAAAVKVGLSLVSGSSGGIKDREFLGRTISTLTTTPAPGSAASAFSFSASGGYLAMSADAGILEEFLRSSDSKAKKLDETAGLAEAAQIVGGTGTGWFGYDNQSQNMRPVFNVVRKQPLTLSDILGTPQQALSAVGAGDTAANLREWADFSLLPSFDAISKYFYYSVYAGGFSPEGFTLKIFAPTPPGLR